MQYTMLVGKIIMLINPSIDYDDNFLFLLFHVPYSPDVEK